MSGFFKQFGRLGGLSLVAGAFLLLSAPHSVSIADDDIKALERKLELLKKKASRKTEYKKMRGMLEVKLKEVQDQIQMLDEEYKDVAKSAPAPVAKKKAAKKKKAAVKTAVAGSAPKKRTRRRRKQTIKKIYWIVFSSTMKPVAKFEFHEKKEALAKVETLSKKSPHFLQKRKEEEEVEDE